MQVSDGWTMPRDALSLPHCFAVHAGKWWVEYIAFHTVASVQTAVKNGFGQQLVLPVGTHAEKELFHGISRQHAKVASVQGKGLAMVCSCSIVA